jgi:hypothetical protein
MGMETVFPVESRTYLTLALRRRFLRAINSIGEIDIVLAKGWMGNPPLKPKEGLSGAPVLCIFAVYDRQPQ